MEQNIIEKKYSAYMKIHYSDSLMTFTLKKKN